MEGASGDESGDGITPSLQFLLSVLCPGDLFCKISWFADLLLLR